MQTSGRLSSLTQWRRKLDSGGWWGSCWHLHQKPKVILHHVADLATPLGAVFCGARLVAVPHIAHGRVFCHAGGLHVHLHTVVAAGAVVVGEHSRVAKLHAPHGCVGKHNGIRSGLDFVQRVVDCQADESLKSAACQRFLDCSRYVGGRCWCLHFSLQFRRWVAGWCEY